nr:hypothetical protein [uncultured Methanolobus sp.]
MMDQVTKDLKTLEDIKDRILRIMLNADYGAVTFDENEKNDLLDIVCSLLEKYPEDEDALNLGKLAACGYYTLKHTIYRPFRYEAEGKQE